MERIDSERCDLSHIRISIRRTTAQHDSQIKLAFIDRGANRFRVSAAHAFERYASIAHFTTNGFRHSRPQRANVAAAEPQMDRCGAVHANVVHSGQADEHEAEDAKGNPQPPTFGRHETKSEGRETNR